jgi:hypothetical protein
MEIVRVFIQRRDRGESLEAAEFCRSYPEKLQQTIRERCELYLEVGGALPARKQRGGTIGLGRSAVPASQDRTDEVVAALGNERDQRDGSEQTDPASREEDPLREMLSSMWPLEYHLGQGVLDHLRARAGEGQGDPEHLRLLLESGLEFRVVHPFHRRLFDARVRQAAIATIAARLAEQSPKSYFAITGALSSSFNEDRFTGPLSLCRYQFSFQVEMDDGTGDDLFAGRIDYQDDGGTLLLRDVDVRRHELNAEFADLDCGVCDYESSVYFLQSESPSSRADFPCPVCAHRESSDGSLADRRRVFARGIETVTLADLARSPDAYHLRKVRCCARIDRFPESCRLIDPGGDCQLRVWPSLRADAQATLQLVGPTLGSLARTMEGIFKYSGACLDGNARSVETLEPELHTSTAQLIRSVTRRFGHMGLSDAELWVTRICD